MTLIQDFLARNADHKKRPAIAVVGDAMIDEYYYVKSCGLSPEFQIPIMKSVGSKPNCVSPGGAANVANQFKHFWSWTVLHSFLDRRMREVCAEHGILLVGVQLPKGGRCPVKRRLYDGEWPTYRWDIERPNYGLETLPTQELADTVCLEYKCVIYSDYDKGVFSGAQFPIANNFFYSIVDPKNGNLEKWRGCSVFKPNSVEAQRLSGLSNWKEQCDFFVEKIGCRAVVITQGGEGVVGEIDGSYFEYRPKQQVRATSVIGAGDCFVAFLALAIAHDFSINEAAQIAFDAGAVYVQKRHNEPITPQQLLDWDQK